MYLSLLGNLSLWSIDKMRVVYNEIKCIKAESIIREVIHSVDIYIFIVAGSNSRIGGQYEFKKHS